MQGDDLKLKKRSLLSKEDEEEAFCVKDDCPNPTIHKSGYCSSCRTFNCPACKKKHTVNERPHRIELRLCARCRQNIGNVKKIKEGWKK